MQYADPKMAVINYIMSEPSAVGRIHLV